MKRVVATKELDDFKVGDIFDKEGINRVILSISKGKKVTTLDLSDESDTDEDIAREIAKQQALATMTVTTLSRKEFYANAEARVDMLSGLGTVQVDGRTEAPWKLVTGWETITVDELNEAMMLALQKKGEIISQF